MPDKVNVMKQNALELCTNKKEITFIFEKIETIVNEILKNTDEITFRKSDSHGHIYMVEVEALNLNYHLNMPVFDFYTSKNNICNELIVSKAKIIKEYSLDTVETPEQFVKNYYTNYLPGFKSFAAGPYVGEQNTCPYTNKNTLSQFIDTLDNVIGY